MPPPDAGMAPLELRV